MRVEVLIQRIEDAKNTIAHGAMRTHQSDQFAMLNAGKYQGLDIAKQIIESILEEDAKKRN